VSDNVSVYAASKSAKVKVKLNLKGGSLSYYEKSTKYVKKGTKIGKLPKPYRSNYTFVGWYTAKSGGAKILSSTKVKAKKSWTIYAYWAKTNPVVTFNPNGGTLASYNTSKSFTYKSTYYSLPTPSRSGYDFLGWYTKKSGGSKITSSSKVTIKGNKTFYAHWKVQTQYTLYYDANGGSVSPNSKRLSVGQNYGDLPTPERVGYSFEGWYTDAINGSEVHSSAYLNLKKNVTIYAHWKAAEYNVTFDGNGGTSNQTSTNVTFGEAYGALPGATRSMYDFAGWFTESVGGIQVKAASVVEIGSNHTLYAHWTLKQSVWLAELVPFSGYFFPNDAWTDNVSGVYSNNILVVYNNNNIPYTTIVYLLDGQYNTFSGTIAIAYASRNDTTKLKYKIYADNVLIYTSPEITGGSDPLVRPVDFSVSVHGVEFLKIERVIEYEGHNQFETAFVNATLKR
jgi:uncharacterized repeat protein (TIGR02543 family)